jgi:hypothetical protein
VALIKKVGYEAMTLAAPYFKSGRHGRLRLRESDSHNLNRRRSVDLCARTIRPLSENSSSIRVFSAIRPFCCTRQFDDDDK